MVTKEFFGKTIDGVEIYKYWIENNKGMKAAVINYGAILVNLFVPDHEGRIDDVVLGYNSLECYFENGSFFGATVGPNANRIGGASFEIDGIRYQLDVNDGANNLHSHMQNGYHKRIWDAEAGEDHVRFSLCDKDGNMGFPGNKEIQVTYTLTDENALEIHYEGSSDRDTVINMTNHTYFNLAGQGKGTIHDHVLTLYASSYTPIIPGAIPTGEIASVEGTPFDFTSGKRIGEEIEADNEQLKMTGGYDHNWVIDDANGKIRKFAEAKEPVCGRCMEVFTDLPGVQFYAGNSITPQTGKGNMKYGPRSGFCLETQYYPDTANKPQFPSCIFGPDRKYDSTTVYKFI